MRATSRRRRRPVQAGFGEYLRRQAWCCRLFRGGGLGYCSRRTGRCLRSLSTALQGRRYYYLCSGMFLCIRCELTEVGQNLYWCHRRTRFSHKSELCRSGSLMNRWNDGWSRMGWQLRLRFAASRLNLSGQRSFRGGLLRRCGLLLRLCAVRSSACGFICEQWRCRRHGLLRSNRRGC